MGKNAQRRREPEQRYKLYDTDSYDQAALGQLPPKAVGKHRWVALASYVLTEAEVRSETASREGGAFKPTLLDNRNRWAFSIGCVDCGQQYPDVTPDTVCQREAFDA